MCLKALSERFAKCEVKVSPPLVPYRETVYVWPSSEFNHPGTTGEDASMILNPPASSEYLDPMSYLPAPWVDFPGLDKVREGCASAITGNGSLSISLSCGTIPNMALSYLLKIIENDSSVSNQSTGLDKDTPRTTGIASSFQEFNNKSELQRLVSAIDAHAAENYFSEHSYDSNDSSNDVWNELARFLSPNEVDSTKTSLSFRQLVSIGPDLKGPNLLMLSRKIKLVLWKDAESLASVQKISEEAIGNDGASGCAEEKLNSPLVELFSFDSSEAQRCLFHKIWTRILRPSVVTGFQVVCARGPMMEEPLQGVCFFINEINLLCSELPRDLLDELHEYLCSNAEGSTCVSEPFNSKEIIQSSNILTGNLIAEVYIFNVTFV